MVAGTKGYENSIARFTECSQSLDFNKVCEDFLEFQPTSASHVLDIGSGIVQNADTLAKLGFIVTAVELITEFIKITKENYKNTMVNRQPS